jgi:predicted RNase H-like HicB family nuclease
MSQYEMAHIHGKTCAEAVKYCEEVLEMLVEHYQAEGRSLPRPKVRVS